MCMPRKAITGWQGETSIAVCGLQCGPVVLIAAHSSDTIQMMLLVHGKLPLGTCARDAADMGRSALWCDVHVAHIHANPKTAPG